MAHPPSDPHPHREQEPNANERLAGEVAHAFNNLLTPISGCAELLLMGMEPSHPHYQIVRTIQSAGQQSAELTEKLLVFSGRLPPTASVLALDGAVANLKPSLIRLVDARADLEIDLGAGGAGIRAELEQVEQILTVLLLNACDAMSHGGRVTIATETVAFDESPPDARPPAVAGRCVMLSVTDTGVGMTPAAQARVFEPFFTTKKERKGTRLGLATVHGIVKHAGGAIVVSSEVGRGTSFRLYFPNLEPSPSADVSSSQVAEPAPTTATVLVVDDEPSLRTFVAVVLEAKGFTVLQAGTGHEALELMHQHGPEVDIALIDLMIPDMDGREVASRLRAVRPLLPIIYTSGYPDGPRQQDGQEDVDEFLWKPFGPTDIVRKLRTLLRRRSEP